MTYIHNTIVGLLLTVVIILCVTTDTASGKYYDCSKYETRTIYYTQRERKRSCCVGYTGCYCNILRGSGTLRSCNFEFQDDKYKVLFSGKCGSDANGIAYQHYSNIMYPNRFVANYEVYYNVTENRPPWPSYVTSFTVGLISSEVKPSLINTDDENVWSGTNIGCNILTAPSRNNPHQSMVCDDVSTLWNAELHNGYKLSLTINSVSGGNIKYVDGRSQTKYYAGESYDEHVMDIVFDFEPPKHCTETRTCADENSYPCEFYPDISRNDQVLLEWNGWNDTGSGLDQFVYTVYRMKLDEDGQLVEGDVYIPRTVWPDKVLPEVTVNISGMYSMHLEVSDAAGNTAMARSLYLYDSSSVIEILEDKPLITTGATLIESIYWVTEEQNYLEINWKERYINKFLHDNKLLSEVKHLPNVIDDEYGNFTSAKVPNVQGITRFGIYISEKNEIPNEEKYENIAIESPNYYHSTQLDEGDVLYVFLLTSDIFQNAQAEIVTVGVDTTAAQITNRQNINFNAEEQSQIADFPYASSVSILVVDGESGILSINFTVIDYTSGNDLTVQHAIQSGQRHPLYNTAEECNAGEECYCASVGGCFTNIQKVWLNNCWFDGIQDHAFRMDFTVLNRAGLETTDTYNLPELSGIPGLGYYPPPIKLRYITHSENIYKITLTWEYEASCYEAKTVYYIYTTHVKKFVVDVSPDENIQKLDGLRPSTTYNVEMYIQYENGPRSVQVEVNFTTLSDGFEEPKNPENIPASVGLPVEALAGIIIVGIIVAVLLAGVIILLVRKKQNKTMVPPVVRSAGRSIRHRFSRIGREQTYHFAANEQSGEAGSMHMNFTHDNKVYTQPVQGGLPPDKPPPYEASFKVAYLGADDDDIYTYGNIETEEDATWKVSNDKLVMGGDLPNAKGRFADLKLATLKTTSGSKTVVAKMNKVSATDMDKLLMMAKMNFVATGVPQNQNLLQFIAAVPPPQGPMILMEYCDGGRLSDWLKDQKKVTDKIEDLMINFSIQVAAGMNHLHGAEILHRRLGARNILVTKNMSKQLVAKVTGFGPMKGEHDGKSEKGKADKVPFKWMAPEQFGVKPQGRIYTPKTDVWSYGILLHEIFSKGEQPYPELDVVEVKTKVPKGYRMTKTQVCPDYVYSEVMAVCWEENPDERPSFEDIHTSLKHFFEGGVTQGEYAYDGN